MWFCLLLCLKYSIIISKGTGILFGCILCLRTKKLLAIKRWLSPSTFYSGNLNSSYINELVNGEKR